MLHRSVNEPYGGLPQVDTAHRYAHNEVADVDVRDRSESNPVGSEEYLSRRPRGPFVSVLEGVGMADSSKEAAGLIEDGRVELDVTHSEERLPYGRFKLATVEQRAWLYLVMNVDNIIGR